MSYTVTVQPSGVRFEARDNETVLDAALRAGIELPYGCRNGTCGTCRARLVAGGIHYPFDRSPPGDEAREEELLVCSAVPTSDLTIEARAADPQAASPHIMPARVEYVEQACPDVRRLLIKLPESVRMPFRAGQYLNIMLRDGRRRAFSIANAPHDDAFIELHIRHVSGGEFTAHVFDELRAKEVLRVEGPLGTFTLNEASGRPAILMAGGTGFAPLKGMIEHALYIGLDKPMHLFWGGRTEADLYMLALARQWAWRHPQIRFTAVVERPEKAGWAGETGLVTEAVVAAYPDLSAHELYAAGPPAMVEAAAKLFIARGLPPLHLHSDAFTFAHDGTPQRRKA